MRKHQKIVIAPAGFGMSRDNVNHHRTKDLENIKSVAVDLYKSAVAYGNGSLHRAEKVARDVDTAWIRSGPSGPMYIMVDEQHYKEALEAVKDNGLVIVEG